MLDLKIGLKDKLTIMLAVVTFVCVAAFSYSSYQRSKTVLIESLRENLKNTAAALVLSIDADQVKKVLGSTDQSPAYWALKRQLNHFTEIGNKQVYGAYLLVTTPKNGTWQFVADDELTDEANMVGFKEEYDVSQLPDLQLAFAGPQADHDVTVDKWGRWLSGYAPVYDRSGLPVAVFGIDMKAADVDKLKNDIYNSALFYLLVGAIASLLLGRVGAYTITDPIVALAKGVKAIGDRKYGSRIEIKRNDEIGDLIKVFNQMSEKLGEVDKIKTDFLSVISHELYTPLTPIRGGAETIKNLGGLTDELKQIVTMIERQAAKMQGLIDEVLDFSWLEVQELKLNKEPVVLNDLVSDVAKELEPARQKKALELTFNLLQEPVTIKADRKRLRHVIKILVDNAIRFSAEKGKVTISTLRSSQGIEFSISDQGVGIAAGNLTKIFDSFYQTEDHLTREHGGLGLGLAIAKRIIEAHGGVLTAESPGPGKGSRFYFTLPLA